LACRGFPTIPLNGAYGATRLRYGGTVHPHACGDDAVGTHTTTANFGTPPRVWGRRLINAQRGGLGLVHPHACGDDAAGRRKGRAAIGTPPRVWGRHWVLCSLRGFLQQRQAVEIDDESVRHAPELNRKALLYVCVVDK